MNSKIFFLLILCFLQPLWLTAEDSYSIYPFSKDVIIDGKADDPVWGKIPFSTSLVPNKGQGKVIHDTRFKLYSNKEKLFILVELKGQNLAEIKKTNVGSVETQNKFQGDCLVFFFSPQPEIDDHYKIYIDYNGNVKDCFSPAKAGHGFPYSAQVDYSWSSEPKCAFAQAENGTIFLELEISVKSMVLEKNLFAGFGFNLMRKSVYFKPNKNNDKRPKKLKEETTWANINGDSWDTKKFGLIKGPLYSEPENYSEADLQNLDQMTNGMTALMKSLDIYFKAINEYKYHIPEGTEINGDIGNSDHVPIPQYPVKADGYYRFYNALKYEPYKKLGNHIINKLYQGYSETKSANGKSYLIWNNLMSDDGKVYGYDQGKKMSLFARGRVPYDQSNNAFNIKDVMFQGGLGQGFVDLSEIKESLDLEIVSKIKEMLRGTLEFLHQPYVLVDNGEEYYWRIDSFKALNPVPFEGKLEKKDWQYLGQDIVLMYVALAQFDEVAAEQFENSMVKFADFYMNGRKLVSDITGPHSQHNIYKLDLRMLALANFGKRYNKDAFSKLNDWLQENLPEIYKDIPKVNYSVGGATRNSWSTQGVLEIYRQLGMKTEYKKFWDLCFTNNMKPSGLFQGHRILLMNFSSYPLYYDYAKKAFDSKIFDEEELKSVYKKMFFFYGNPKIHRNNIMYGRDLTEEQRNRPMWGNTPYDCYVEGVLPEGIYANASSQAFYSIFGNYSINEFFKTREEHARYEYNFRYYQYTGPFQYHTDQYSYGKAESLCLVKMKKPSINLEELDENLSCLVRFESNGTPLGMPMFGSLDVSNIIFKNETATIPTGLKLSKVTLGDKEIPFRSYQILEYDRILSKKDKAKVVFGLWNNEPNKEIEIKLHFKKKVFRNYFTEGADK